ncbi:MAG: DUF3048 domain-containing protein [Actinobacteria bacterium]|nr:DUF3048 domain-containing protein [Actinomycetota bacterium]MCA1720861.1 DUF3048 domain-containing protein [Actinomycetota bacterium]
MNRRPLLALLMTGVAATACSGSSTPAAQLAAPSRSPSASASPSPSPSPKPPALNPLTGVGPVPTSPVVVVKVDNGGLARPYHRGLGRAAVVYQELVESGETRFAAVYTDASTGEVGPVRSLRESDIELLRQYGKVPVAFSGANAGIKALMASAVRSGYLLDASYDTVPQDYRLAERRRDARNFFTTTAAVAASRPGAPARDIGFRFGALPPGSGTPTNVARAVYSNFVTVTLRYVPSSGRWSVTQNKRLMPGVAPANVVVQQVPIRTTRFVDVLGHPTPYTTTVGSGGATVLRDGRAIKARWRRLSPDTGTRYLDAAGKDVPLKPGPTWVLLLPQGRPLTLS